MQKWNDAHLESELRHIATAIGHFPSNSELRGMGRMDVASQVGRRGGFLAWASRLGIERQGSDSDTGWEGEDAAAQQLAALGFSIVRRDGVKCPFDLLVDGVLRVDVKAARFCQYGHCQGWFFCIGKHPQADLVLLWQLDRNEYYALPWFVCPTTNITITSSGGKYSPFRNNAEVIRQMVRVRCAERQASPAMVN